MKLEIKENNALIEGALSVSSVFRKNSRIVDEIFVANDVKEDNYKIKRIIVHAKRNNIPVSVCERSVIDENAEGKTHGGILASVGERKMLTAEEIFKKENGFVFMLCGIEDPFNFGYAIRSLYACGATGMIVSKRSWLSAAGTVIRASAGTSELIDCAISDDNEKICTLAKENGYSIVCAEENSKVQLTNCTLKKPIFLVVGGEKRGISKDILSNCDLKVTIPYAVKFKQSLTAAVGAAIFGYEIMRQSMNESGE